MAGRPGEERRGAEEGWLWVEVCTQGGGADPGLTGQKQGDLEMGAGGGRTLWGQTGDAR